MHNNSISRHYIQNRTNWCWAVACKMLGEQFRIIHPGLRFGASNNIYPNRLHYNNKTVFTCNMEGLRREAAWQQDGKIYIDLWQREIVRNAMMPDCADPGNLSGDDEAKERGIRFAATGDCDSTRIQVISAGTYDSGESLLVTHREQIWRTLRAGNYIIGNAVINTGTLYHSFVLADWRETGILLYDPWDGSSAFHRAENIFEGGFTSALGTGIVKWIQYIVE